MTAASAIYGGLAESLETLGITRELEREFRLGWHFQDVVAAAHQQEVAQINQRLPRRFMGHGLGQVRMQITPKFYWDMVAKFGRECWKDKSFRRSVEKKNPEVRVISQSDKCTVRVQGMKSESESNRRTIKTYA